MVFYLALCSVYALRSSDQDFYEGSIWKYGWNSEKFAENTDDDDNTHKSKTQDETNQILVFSSTVFVSNKEV